MTHAAPLLTFRDDVLPGDRELVRAMISASGFFSDAEVDVAVELVDERLARGPASGYEFLFAERDGSVLGYACFGEIPCTVGSYDLYWIAVDPGQRGRGLGRAVFAACEDRIAARGGRGIYIETSCRPQYVPTRKFYERCGCRLIAELPDFYAPGDAKAIYWKPAGAPAPDR